jgi:hypothetical protein
LAKAPKLYHWRIYLIRKKGEFIGSVEAPDENAAIAAAIELQEGFVLQGTWAVRLGYGRRRPHSGGSASVDWGGEADISWKAAL